MGAEAETGASGTTEGITETGAGSPSAVDNSALKYFPPIRGQGSLNACAQWAVLHHNTPHEMAMVRDWNARRGGGDYRVTLIFAYNFLNGGANNDTWIGDAWWVAERHGIRYGFPLQEQFFDDDLLVGVPLRN